MRAEMRTHRLRLCQRTQNIVRVKAINGQLSRQSGISKPNKTYPSAWQTPSLLMLISPVHPLRLVRRRRPSVCIVCVQAALNPSTIAHTWCHERFVHSNITGTRRVQFFPPSAGHTRTLMREYLCRPKHLLCICLYVGASRNV